MQVEHPGEECPCCRERRRREAVTRAVFAELGITPDEVKDEALALAIAEMIRKRLK